jgi:uncharacterized protein Yka (UPF0111/DUF47 family)
MSHQPEKADIRKHLEKQFREYLPKEDVPESLKDEVFQSLDRIRFAAELMDLFTGKFTASELEFLTLISEQRESPAASETEPGTDPH